MGIVMSRNGNVSLLGRESSIAAGRSILPGTLRFLELLFEIQGVQLLTNIFELVLRILDLEVPRTILNSLYLVGV